MSERETGLEAIFGGPSDDAFGSAVFRRAWPEDGALDPIARAVYRDFVGELWERFGAEAWLAPWSRVAARDSGPAPSVVDLLRALEDPSTRSAADMLVEASPDPAAARGALVEAFDRVSVSALEIFSIGDGAAMSGVLIAAHDRAAAEAVCVVFLMD